MMCYGVIHTFSALFARAAKSDRVGFGKECGTINRVLKLAHRFPNVLQRLQTLVPRGWFQAGQEAFVSELGYWMRVQYMNIRFVKIRLLIH